MSKPLVIVESPAKARTIARFLGDGYVVESSVGHIRDLPANASEIPADVKGKPWASIGVDVEGDFAPVYVVSREKKEHVRTLKSLIKDASALYLATDEDREGEAIAWHLLEVLQPKVPVHRMVFHEITRPAIEEAIRHPRDLDEDLVEAQEARRILDRLFGYEVSPVLWKKVATGLSAGRVQSVATRIVVERERERMAFRAASYWDVDVLVRALREQAADTGSPEFKAKVVAIDGARIATGRDFTSEGTLARKDALVLDEAGARGLADDLLAADVRVTSVERKPYRRKPSAPFATSTLQQEAGRKLRLTARRTMQVAQRLYENGYITYMRTDSVTLSETAIAAARDQIRAKYGDRYLPAQPRRYTSKVKNAQEAHEAIRPAGEVFRTPDEVRGELEPDAHRLYELIWQRTIASQMEDATGESVSVRLGAVGPSGREVELSASGRTITFPGFLRAYVEGRDDPDAELEDREVHLPQLEQGDRCAPVSAEPDGHETQPPPRFTEASLVQRLEELGVGRPSTYASILGTIQDRGYVVRKGSALVPSFTAFAVTTLLERHFPDLVDYAFTARMEDQLDEIAAGHEDQVPWLRRFYLGEDEPGLKERVSQRLGEIDAAEVNSIPLGQDAEGRMIVARVGRYGPYLQRGDDKASIPEDLAPDELTIDKATELLDAPSTDRVLGTDPATGKPVVARAGRYGPYVQVGEVGDGKPDKTASLLKEQSLDAITLEDALQLLTLPRTVAAHPETGEDIVLANGRYGPFLKCGKETRSLEQEEQLFTLDLEGALRLLATPPRRGRAAATAPLREMGNDPVSGQPMVVKTGRFGPYVSDGTVNASLRKGDTVEGLTDERASELLALRREKVAADGGTPAKARGRKRS